MSLCSQDLETTLRLPLGFTPWSAGHPNLRHLLSVKAVFVWKFDKFPFEIHAYSPLPRFGMEILSTPRQIQVSKTANPQTALWAEKNVAERMCLYISSLARRLAPGSPRHSRMNDSTAAFSFSSINIHNRLVGRERAGTLMNVCRHLLPNTTRRVFRSTTGSSAARKLKVGFSLPLERKVTEKQHNLWFYYFLKTTEARFSFYL